MKNSDGSAVTPQQIKENMIIAKLKRVGSEEFRGEFINKQKVPKYDEPIKYFGTGAGKGLTFRWGGEVVLFPIDQQGARCTLYYYGAPGIFPRCHWISSVSAKVISRSRDCNS